MKQGQGDIDIRKGVSVEKRALFTEDSHKVEVEVIQHSSSNEQDEIPEMIRDKHVEIIKQTHHELSKKNQN